MTFLTCQFYLSTEIENNRETERSKEMFYPSVNFKCEIISFKNLLIWHDLSTQTSFYFRF